MIVPFKICLLYIESTWPSNQLVSAQMMMMMIIWGFGSLEEGASVPWLCRCLQLMGLADPFLLPFLLDNSLL